MKAQTAFCLTLVNASLIAIGLTQSALAQTSQRQLLPPSPPVRNATGNKPRWRNGLPPTVLDSFVYEAHEHRDHIYGDEGDLELPPYMSFTKTHRINTGILDERDKGLTTGHGSYMPDAWGADEFLAPPGEWSQSGCRGRTRAQGFVDGTAQRIALTQYSNNTANPSGYDLGTNNSGAGSSDTGSDGNTGNQLPPPPGDGYMAVFQHGRFVGYIAPGEDMLQFVRSDRYLGGEMGARSIEYELGARSHPIF